MQSLSNLYNKHGFGDALASSHYRSKVDWMELRKGPNMRYLKLLALVGVFLFSASFAHAQSFSVGFGVGPVYEGPAYGPPDCVYGYYSYYPYACAPYGYYGPDWFSDGFFIGAGPWYHGYYGRGDFDGR